MASERDESVLIVEDDASLANGLGHNLRFEGYHVRVAMDGPTGLKMALEHHPDLIVLDIMMPGMDGFTVLEKLRDEGVESQVIILSARDLEHDKVNGLRLGADDYVTKPFSLQELLARVEAALRRPRQRRRAQAEEVLTFADVELRPARREASRAGEPLKMTATEFDLLEFLVRRPERAFTRDQLLEEIWGTDYDGTARTVDNFIRKLRSKIEPDPAQPSHLETVHGIGYKFVP